MPKRMRLNDKSVREPLPVKGRDYQIFDTEVRGFAVCIYRSGSRAFTLDYRYAGRQRRITIGRWPEWTVTAATAPGSCAARLTRGAIRWPGRASCAAPRMSAT